MSIKIDESYPTLIREFGSYRISRKKVSYKASIGIFIIEENTPDIYGVPSWKIIDKITPDSKHYQWTRTLLESLWNDINSIPEPAPKDFYRDIPVDPDDKLEL